jgi:hypothetical protein
VNSSTHRLLSATVHATCTAPIASAHHSATSAAIRARRGFPAPSSLPTCISMRAWQYGIMADQKPNEHSVTVKLQ